MPSNQQEKQPPARLTQEAAVPVFARVRDKVEHEDELVHQRMTWLMTLQGLLFTAYGFSMSGEASALTSKGLDSNPTALATEALSRFTSNLNNIRYGLVLLGILASAAALVGVLAAFRAIRDDAALWKTLEPENSEPPFPQIIGTGSANTLGMICGISLPYTTAAGWVWVGGLYQTHPTWTVVLALISAIPTLLYVFFKLKPRG